VEDWVRSNLSGRKFREEFSVAVYHPVGLTVMLRCESFAFFHFGMYLYGIENGGEWWWLLLFSVVWETCWDWGWGCVDFGGMSRAMLLAKHDFGLLDLYFLRLWILFISRPTMSLSLSYLYSVTLWDLIHSGMLNIARKPDHCGWSGHDDHEIMVTRLQGVEFQSWGKNWGGHVFGAALRKFHPSC